MTEGKLVEIVDLGVGRRLDFKQLDYREGGVLEL